MTEEWLGDYVLFDDIPDGLLVDDPEADGTDFAHPAWFRGHDHTMAVLCQMINEILDGKEPSGISNEPWESTRQRVSELVPKWLRRPTGNGLWYFTDRKDGTDWSVVKVDCWDVDYFTIGEPTHNGTTVGDSDWPEGYWQKVPEPTNVYSPECC